MKNNFTQNNIQTDNNLPNPVIVSRQISSLRKVLRRMKTSQSNSLDSLSSQKLEQVAHH